MNSVNIIGNLTREPEVKYTGSGAVIVELGIAWNGRKKVGDDWVDQVHFFNVTCFGERFEKLSTYISKGSKIGVSGRLDFQKWETEGGETRTAVKIIASDITFANSKKDENNSSGYTPSNTPDDDNFPF